MWEDYIKELLKDFDFDKYFYDDGWITYIKDKDLIDDLARHLGKHLSNKSERE
jgi:hypothetical protein